MRFASLAFVAAAVVVSPCVASAADFPLDQLPPHISLALANGERPDWEPGGSEWFAYLTEPGGSPREHSLVTGEDREIGSGLTGVWRLAYLRDRNFVATIGRDRGNASIHVIDASGTIPPTNLDEIAHEGVAVARYSNNIAWTVGHEIFFGTIAYDANGVPFLEGKTKILDGTLLPFYPTGDGTNYGAQNGDIEPQNFRPPLEEELIFSRYGQSTDGKYSAETWTYNFRTGEVINQSNRPYWYDEPEGVFPDGEYTLVENDMFLPVSNHAQVLDLYRMKLDGTGTDMLRLTHFGDVEHSPGVAFKANQGVISWDGKYMLFGEGRSNTNDQPGSGFGIYLFDFAAAGIEVAVPPAPGGTGVALMAIGSSDDSGGGTDFAAGGAAVTGGAGTGGTSMTGGTAPIGGTLGTGGTGPATGGAEPGTGGSGEVTPRTVGLFDIPEDILCPHFDTKPDLDDVHAQAAVGSVVAHPDLAGVDVFAVAGAYGEQGGEFVESLGVMELAFPGNWTSTTGTGYSWAAAVEQSALRMAAAINRGGDVWIAEAGQSDFSHDAIQLVLANIPGTDPRRFHIVQHSQWNEDVSDDGKVAWLKANIDYIRIDDGNFPNATPDFKTFPDWDTSKGNDPDGQLAGVEQLWTHVTSHATLGPLWTEAKRVADHYNPIAAYNNTAIQAGGFDFSDASEVCHIFGMGKPLINDHVDFFNVFVP